MLQDLYIDDLHSYVSISDVTHSALSGGGIHVERLLTEARETLKEAFDIYVLAKSLDGPREPLAALLDGRPTKITVTVHVGGRGEPTIGFLERSVD